MSDLAYPPVQQAMKRLQELSRNGLSRAPGRGSGLLRVQAYLAQRIKARGADMAQLVNELLKKEPSSRP